MKKELDEQLCKLAPHLFADRRAPMQVTCMCWGFDVGDGWYKIIEEAAMKLEPLIVAEIAKDPDAWQFGFFRAAQVKEKFGTLRFYISGVTDEMHDIVSEAENKSHTICETCGKPGKLCGNYWVFTRCAKCWKKEQKDA